MGLFTKIVSKGLFGKKKKSVNVERRLESWLLGVEPQGAKGFRNSEFIRFKAQNGNPAYGSGVGQAGSQTGARNLPASMQRSATGLPFKDTTILGMAWYIVVGIGAAVVAVLYFVFKPKKRRR